ncbi:DUF1153 domain-containing protein [Jannaschia sp. Os4]|uniref:CtrA inhibitor SciP n=1 Tax=Jannaschia sp. Os4 TaxID=2807617 RepID=UPI001939AB6F|nr:DUF1153 domain-containing protein [Jannaschia sp. Os4]MBM2577004.1 DUF1153 domain-containing protein [Jannaschia sp. Os4]
MFLRRDDRPRVVTLPDGRPMTRDDLPPAGERRWVASRKAAVVLGVEAGLLSRDEAFLRYDLSEEEYAQWVHGASTHGAEGLRATRRMPAAPTPGPVPAVDADAAGGK